MTNQFKVTAPRNCDLCSRTATRVTDKWYRYRIEFKRFTAFCEGHWELYLDDLSGKAVDRDHLQSEAGGYTRAERRRADALAA